MHSSVTYTKYLAIAGTLALASPAAAQGPRAPRTLELGADAGVVFGLGDESSINFRLPASRFRVGYFLANPRWSVEPAAGFGYNKVEGTDGVFSYDVEVGALYHLRPFVLATTEQAEGTEINDVIARVRAPYVRPFVGLTGFTGGDTDDNEVTLGAGFGIKVPWRRQIAWRLEANLGYGLDNEAARLGLLAGLSFFAR